MIAAVVTALGAFQLPWTCAPVPPKSKRHSPRASSIVSCSSIGDPSSIWSAARTVSTPPPPPPPLLSSVASPSARMRAAYSRASSGRTRRRCPGRVPCTRGRRAAVLADELVEQRDPARVRRHLRLQIGEHVRHVAAAREAEVRLLDRRRRVARARRGSRAPASSKAPRFTRRNASKTAPSSASVVESAGIEPGVEPPDVGVVAARRAVEERALAGGGGGVLGEDGRDHCDVRQVRAARRRVVGSDHVARRAACPRASPPGSARCRPSRRDGRGRAARWRRGRHRGRRGRTRSRDAP